jgi:hypothetical protein
MLSMLLRRRATATPRTRVWLVGVCLALWTPMALAQSAPSAATAPQADPRDAEARALFEQGVAALTDERYTDALPLFERSYAIRRAASVALNLGICLRALGRVTEARQRFSEFLEVASPAQHERHDREVANYIQDVSRRIARVHVRSIDPPGARVTVDGRRAVMDDRDEIAMDPGERRIEATLQGHTTATQTVRLEAGGRAEIDLVLRPIAPDPRVTIGAGEGGGAARPAGGSSVLQSPWLWLGVGLGVTAAVVIPLAIVLAPKEPALPGVFCVRTDASRCATGGL